MAGLFASSSANNANKPAPLFGASTNAPSLFGSGPAPASNNAPSLFGNTTTQTQTAQTQRPTLSLFGTAPSANTTAQPNAAQGQTNTGLFGSQPTGGNLFNQPKPPSLFGAPPNASMQQPANTSLFAQSQPQPQNQQQPVQQLGGSTAIGSVWNPTTSMQPREKSVQAQMDLLINKWAPTSPSCVFQHYFYNQVSEQQAPYYAPGPNEDEKKWEEALKSKPTPGSIPVLAKGPMELGKRLEMQAHAARGIQARLHEINDALTKRLQAHDLEYSVRAAEARRRHVALGRRTLALAVKVQMLRNRGYTLDGNEETLKTKLLALERVAFDPMLSGRQEEIWARMSVLRERAEMLGREAEGVARQVNGQAGGPLDEEQLKKVEKILGNYEAQLNQLNRERESAETDFKEWQATQAAPPKG